MGQLPDVLYVVEEAVTLYHFNSPTNNPNDEMDEAEMETNTTGKLGVFWASEPVDEETSLHVEQAYG